MGLATLKYHDEENSLVLKDDPEQYNRDVIFPDKVRINRGMSRDILLAWMSNI